MKKVSIVVTFLLIVFFFLSSCSFDKSDFLDMVDSSREYKSASEIKAILGEPDFESEETRCTELEYFDVFFLGRRGTLTVAIYSDYIAYRFAVLTEGENAEPTDVQSTKKYFIEAKNKFSELYGRETYRKELHIYTWNIDENNYVHMSDNEYFYVDVSIYVAFE